MGTADTRGEHLDLNLMQRLRLRLTGKAYLGHRTQPGWRGSLPFYAFLCPVHGLVENYPQGYYSVLRCPQCLQEAENKETANRGSSEPSPR